MEIATRELYEQFFRLAKPCKSTELYKMYLCYIEYKTVDNLIDQVSHYKPHINILTSIFNRLNCFTREERCDLAIDLIHEIL